MVFPEIKEIKIKKFKSSKKSMYHYEKNFFYFNNFYILYYNLCSFTLSVLWAKNGEVLIVSPKKIVIKFKSRAKIFKITLNKVISEDKKSLFGNIISKSNSKKIIIPNDFEIKNSLKHTINLPLLEAGTYIFEWRAISEDGHIIKGTSQFKIKKD